MSHDSHGFKPIDLVIAVVMTVTLTASALPEMTAMNDRAREAKLRINMRLFQRTAEDVAAQANGVYPGHAALVAAYLPNGAGAEFINPFDQWVGQDAAWEDRASFSGPMTARPGLVSYADTVQMNYAIKGYGRDAELELVLTSKK